MPKPSAPPAIRLRGVRHNNLKNFDLDLPLHQLIVITGLSGSGKSSLAFDTLFAEGQRRYIETFSPYARQFFDRMDKPQVESIEGIPPAIAIEQRNSVKSTRSTVGTLTEICDHLKMLWPHVAVLHCRQCRQVVRKDSPQQIWEFLSTEQVKPAAAEVLITFDLSLAEQMPIAESLALISKQGYQRILHAGTALRLDQAAPILTQATPAPRNLTVIQDRIKPVPGNRSRFIEACEQAYHFGKGRLCVHHPEPGAVSLFSNRFHCAPCDLEYREPSPALFSFNHPVGACPACKGFGRTITIDYDRAIPDRGLTLAEGAVKPWRGGFSAESQEDMLKFCKRRSVPVNVPFCDLSPEHQRWVLEGDPGYGKDGEHEWPRAWYGVRGYFKWLESKAYKMHVRVLLSRYRAYTLCPSCQGARFQPESLLYRAQIPQAAPEKKQKIPANSTTSLNLAEFYTLPVSEALAIIEALTRQRQRLPDILPNDPVALVLAEVGSRLGFLNQVGLGYLTLDRPTRSLSGGETERVNLTTCLGTRLVNTLFVLDEPSVGLHPRDTERLIDILHRLRDTGNTVVVVEHEPSVMRAADQIVDIGPGHGAGGGHLVFQGSYGEILNSKHSLTGHYLSGRKQIEIPSRRAVSKTPNAPGRPPHPANAWLNVTQANCHNLKNLAVSIPLNRFVALTGVSGSGKTTFAREILLPGLEARLQTPSPTQRQATDETADPVEDEKPDSDEQVPGAIGRTEALFSGHESLSRIVLVDQSTLGKTPRSNPAVYIGAFEHIREFFAQSEPARQRGLNASAFSFNSAQGQCERCRGAGFEKIEMQFLSDVFIRCPDCAGRRYRAHILEIKIAAGQSAENPIEGSLKTEATPPPTPPSGHDTSLSIADLLDATVDEAIGFLGGFPDSRAAKRAAATLQLLQEVGLGYLKLGQPINTLSGGESQRLKLVSHLAEASPSPNPPAPAGKRTTQSKKPQLEPDVDLPRPACGGTLFLFDEPTTGLHFEDVQILIQVFQRLVDAGHSVLVIEHNLDLIKCADWVVDLGPEAGAGGGQRVAEGTPEEIARCHASHTGHFLRELLGPSFQNKNKKTAQTPVKALPSAIPATGASTGMTIHGAREHNLKNLSLAIPRDKFVVITGVSGSGKSTLAFDLIFAEGQRRFLDSMNVYARQFVEQLARPDVDLITGIPPTVSIEQRTSRGGGKSTVATVTEIFHFLRLLFARLGTQFCPDCQLPVEAQSRDELGRRLESELKKRGDLVLLAPVVKNRKGFHTDVAEWAAKHGYAEVRADGKMFATTEPFRLDRFREHDVEIVTGIMEKRGGPDSRQLIEETLQLGHGTLFALDNRGKTSIHSTECACPDCGRSFEPLDPKTFSYNSPQGWCPKCRGFGELFYLPEVERGANADAIEESWFGWAEERETCPECLGARLNPVARAVRLPAPAGLRPSKSNPTDGKKTPVSSAAAYGMSIEDFSSQAVAGACDFFAGWKFNGRAAEIARDILPEIRERLKFLNEVGLGYLQLGRAVPTLSGGESQRIRLAAQLGSNLSGVLYVLDEPTIGLHARDNEQLLATLLKLRARGNSVIVVEHDEETMRRADYVIDLGPGAGVHGGQVVAAGTLAELLEHPESVTGQCLRAQAGKHFPSRGERRPVASIKPGPNKPQAGRLLLKSVSENNLQNLSVSFPLGRLVCVTGVSGSGKSTLIRECLLPRLQAKLKAKTAAAKHSSLTGHETLKAVYEVDQSPIGRTPRSIPATYVGIFDEIRRLFAQVPEARLRGYSPSRFSFNSAQGRCPACEGAGQIKLEMSFLPPAFVRCEVCSGSRFNRETLDVQYRDRTIAQVLDLSIEEATEFFKSFQKIHRPLQALCDTGLGYLKLGQQSPTLSGGEAQRVKLVTHLLAGLRPGPDAPLAKQPAARQSNLFLLEEPTIGLHMADVRRLVEMLQRLVDAGHSVIVIEHNLQLIAEADWVIDLGPEGGAGGGLLVAEGAPEEVARNKHSHTGRFLREFLG
jgi:excinuclease ABC subunit A